MTKTKNTNQLKTLGRILRVARKRSGLTQQQLATALGVSGPTVAGYETGLNELPALRLLRMATLLRLDLGTLQIVAEAA